MATKKTVEENSEVIEKAVPKIDHDKELVTIRLFKDNNKYKDDLFVAVNGKRWLIQRGVNVRVPRYVARVIEQSLAQDERTAALIDIKSSEFEEESKKY